MTAHRQGKSDQLFHRLALHPQRRQQRADLRISRAPAQDLLHRGIGFSARHVSSASDDFQNFQDHRGPAALPLPRIYM